MRERATHVLNSRKDLAHDPTLYGGNTVQEDTRFVSKRMVGMAPMGVVAAAEGAKIICPKAENIMIVQVQAQGEHELAHWKDPKCWRCRKKGQFRRECEEKLCEG